jgi:hypothetical protein
MKTFIATFFTPDDTFFMSFYADNMPLAKDHAKHLASTRGLYMSKVEKVSGVLDAQMGQLTKDRESLHD